MKFSRRSFLKGAVVAPFILPSHIWAAETKPNSLLTMGFIGTGKQSRHLLSGFLGNDTKVLAVCDVDTTRRENAKKKVDDYYAKKGATSAGCTAYNDFREIIARKDIDAVCIATPDHWHTYIAVAALQARKDVYCEKPLTQNIHESVVLLRAVDANRRVLQTGSMQRSSKEFRIACELVLNGAIGKTQRVECSFGDPAVPCDLPEEPVEPGLDWDRWLGAAPVRPYNAVLSPRGMHDHFPAWRKYREFGGGGVTDWGAHHLDIAQWGLGMDGSGPVQTLLSPRPEEKRGVKLVYANGVTVEHKNGFGVHFFGSEGEVQVNRGKFVFKRGDEIIASYTNSAEDKKTTSCAAQVQKAERAFLANAKIKLYESKNHLSDFLDCVKSRKKPITSEQVGARSAICCHLVNLTYYHGQSLKWDPARFVFLDRSAKAEWLTRDYRRPWAV